MTAHPKASRIVSPGKAASTAQRVRVRRRYGVGSSALVYVGITLLIALGAFNSQNNLLFWTFGLAMASLIVSGIISGAMLMGATITRESVSDARVGEPVRVRYRVHNRNKMVPIFALSIEEEGFGTTARRSLFGRFLRPRRPAAESPRFGAPRTFVAQLGAGETVHVEAVSRAERRGPMPLAAVIAHSSFPFGLMQKSLRFDQPGSTVIRPAILMPEMGVLGTGAARGLSGAVSRRPGPGDEFFSLREYVPGDGFRGIAWMASARRGSLLVRQNASPSPGRVWIVLRLRPTPDSNAHDEKAISLAAGIAQIAENCGMEYGLAVPLTRSIVQPRRGAGHFARLTSELGLLDLGFDDGRGKLSAFPAQAAPVNGLCVVVHSGPVDPSFHPTMGDGVMHVSSDDGLAVAPVTPQGAAA